MAGGLRDEIELDVTSALAQVGKIEAGLDAAAKSFRVELANALDVLRSADTRVDVTADASQVTGAITGAVDAADTGVIVTGDASEVTGSITGAVDAADTTVQVEADTAPMRQLRAEIDRVNAELNDTRQALDRVEGELDQVRRKGRDVEGAFGGIRTAAAGALSALGTRFVIDQIQEMIGAASDLAESQSKVDAVFGESQHVISEWAETSATSVGLAKQEALEAAGTFGNLFTALGLSRDAAAALSPDVVQLGADLASFNNLGVPETLEKLRSGLVGEIEPLRSLGISFGALEVEARAAELGLRDANGTISEGAKIQARWSLITEQSATAAGDFARTSDGLANQQRILTAEMGNARAEIGQRLLPVMLDLVNKGRSILDFFLSLPEPVQNLALGFIALGIAAGPLVLAVGNVSKAVSGVGSAVTGLSKLLSTSTLVIGGWAAALIAVGAVFVAYNKFVQAGRDYQADLNNIVGESVNAQALAAETMQGTNEAMRDQAVAAFVATGGMDRTTESANEVALASNLAADALEAIEEQAPKAAAVLNSLSDSTGVTKERIVQLADAMGINLAEATDEQREKLGTAIAEISRAVSPTERLQVASETLGNQFATTKEQIDAFSEALDAALGVYLSSEEATIRVRQQLGELAKAYKEGRAEGETLQEFTDRMTLSTIDLTRKVEDEVAALTRDGTVSAEAAAQKEALISRLLALADTIGGPMAEELREHAFRIGSIPDEKVTALDVDTAPATEALEGAAATATKAGERVAEGFGSGITTMIDRIRFRIAAAGASAGGALEEGANRRLLITSPSKVGMQIGGFFVEGLVLGVEHDAEVAVQAARALAAGVGDVMLEAAQITEAESLAILTAVASTADAERALSEARKEHGRASIEARIAELELADAQAEVNRQTFAAVDATDAITDAIDRERQARDDLNASLDGTISALSAVSGIRGQQRSLEDAEAELAEARQRSRELPGEIADAERALAEERRRAAATTDEEALAIIRARQAVARAEEDLEAVEADATATRDELAAASLELDIAEQRLTAAKEDADAPTRAVEEAERALQILREEEAESTRRVEEATDAVTAAQIRLVETQRDLVEVGGDLAGSQSEIEDYFRTLAEAAGLSRREVDDLIDALREAAQLGRNADRSTNGGGSGSGGRLVNTVTGRPAFTGPNGEGGWGAPRGVPGERSWTMPDGTRVWYVPNENIDAGNLGALGRVASNVQASAALAPVTPNLPTPPPPPAAGASAAGFGRSGATIDVGGVVVNERTDADYLLRELEFLVTAGRFDD